VPKDDYPDGILWKPIMPIKDDVNTTAGTYWIAIASMWPAPSFNGSGTAFTMTFRVKYHPVQPEPDANITLELYSTELAARGGDPIPHYRQNGKVILHALAASHDIAVTSVHPMKTIVGQGYTMNINVTVANQGDFTETFNVTLYVNTTVIQTRQVTLANKASITLTFTWDTNGFVKGNYTIWAYACPVQGETDIENNTWIDGIVTVTIPGDVDGDRDVDIFDVVKITAIYTTKLGDPRFNPNSDIDNDEKITIFDVVICTSHYAQKDP